MGDGDLVSLDVSRYESEESSGEDRDLLSLSTSLLQGRHLAARAHGAACCTGVLCTMAGSRLAMFSLKCGSTHVQVPDASGYRTQRMELARHCRPGAGGQVPEKQSTWTPQRCTQPFLVFYRCTQHCLSFVHLRRQRHHVQHSSIMGECDCGQRRMAHSFMLKMKGHRPPHISPDAWQFFCISLYRAEA